MKKIIKCCIIIAAILTAAACNNEFEESPMSFSREMTFTATREGVSQDTKTVRMDDGSTWWNASEEISLFYGSGTGGGDKLTSNNTTFQEIVEFSGSVTFTGSGKKFWAVYPYSEDNACDGSSITTVIPDNQTGSEGNFSGDVFPAIAKSTTMGLAFWNVCGGIKFFVSRSDIKSVTFKGNGGEVLAGKVRESFNTEGKPEVVEVLEGKTEVTLNAPNGGTFKAGKYYYITLLPTALDGGFTMTFNTATEQGSVVSNNSQTVKRSIFGVLKNIDSKVSDWEATVAEPEYVDLGLPSGLKWATFNVGANKPEEYGDYFAWGETEPKTDYSWSTYKFELGTDYHGPFSKYVTNNSSYGTVDNKTVLDPEDDAAHVNWGGIWRMPTTAECNELIINCTWTWSSQNGVNGRKVTGPNGKSIFLPAAGYRDGTSLYFAGANGDFWSSSLWTIVPESAWYIVFTSISVGWGHGSGRCLGSSVRPVYDDRVHPESVSLNKSTLSLCVGDSEQLTATVIPDNATVKSVVWSSDNTDVATVDDDGNVTAVSSGSAIITVTTNDGGKTATCNVIVEPIPEPEAVDLGLSVRWASWNLGASSPHEGGYYYSWGETLRKENYDFYHYRWYQGERHEYKGTMALYPETILKYNYEPTFGIVDNLNYLEPEDDAASSRLGGNWRMPTHAEFSELRSNCTWEWTTENGVPGMRITSKVSGHTDKSIFLPAVGNIVSTTPQTVGSLGSYWSSSLDRYTSYAEPYGAMCIHFSESNYFLQGSNRSCGFTIRAVSK